MSCKTFRRDGLAAPLRQEVPRGRVLRRRRVRRGLLLAGLASPLRQEVSRGACSEAQEGQAWLAAGVSCGAFASGGSPWGMS